MRLKGYDYASAGVYFITICTYQGHSLFGEIINSQMQLNEYGQIVADEWLHSANIRQEIELDEWIVMPNHLHGIVFINTINEPQNPIQTIDNPIHPVGANGRSPLPYTPLSHTPLPRVASNSTRLTSNPNHSTDLIHQKFPIPSMKPRSLSSLMAGFKAVTTTRINHLRNAPKTPLWQRSYYDHIIRDEYALKVICRYIESNPLTWQRDQLHPTNASKW
jgi:REP element-mobilizing transposase RayT